MVQDPSNRARSRSFPTEELESDHTPFDELVRVPLLVADLCRALEHGVHAVPPDPAERLRALG